MTTATHTATGFLIVKTMDLLGLIPPDLKTVAYTVGMITANMPDFDILFNFRISGHRESVFHAPIFWLLVLVPVFGVAIFYDLAAVFLLVFISFLCILSHFILDTSDYSQGISWLRPFTRTKYSFNQRKFRHTNGARDLLRDYLHRPHLIIDIVVCSMALLVLLFVK
jgi:hypothetical protein